MTWYFPSHAGDFRLLPVVSDHCKLEIVEPTDAERELLNRFLAEARRRRWTKEKKVHNLEPAERQEVKLSVSIAEAGRLILPMLKPGHQTLTAIKLEDGTLHVVESTEPGALAEIEAAMKATTEARPETDPPPKKKKKKKKGRKAASVKRPTPCCPTCFVDANERASEALLSFLDEEQHEQWATERSIDVTGHLSGHRYRLAHRHSPLAAQWGKICADLTDGGILHFHDWTVPPEEEVLAAKLILEHREPWLRNEATCSFAVGGLLGGFQDVFANPFGDGADGTFEAGQMQRLGSFLLGLTGRSRP